MTLLRFSVKVWISFFLAVCVRQRQRIAQETGGGFHSNEEIVMFSCINIFLWKGR